VRGDDPQRVLTDGAGGAQEDNAFSGRRKGHFRGRFLLSPGVEGPVGDFGRRRRL
jgi:hypothetical protein